MSIPKRAVYPALAIVLLMHLGLLAHNALRKSAGYDEGPHLAAGLAYLKYGEMSIYNLSPPVLRMWAALPAYLAGADVPPAKAYRDLPASSRFWAYFDDFQQRNLSRLHRFVLYGRFALFPFSLLVAVVIFLWARRLHGDLAGLVACAAWSLSPTVLANGSTLGTDMATVFALVAATALWARFVRTPSPANAALAAAAVAVAHTFKFTALLLWPIFIAISLFAIFRRLGRWQDSLAGLLLAVMLTFVLVNAAYGFRLMGDRLDSFSFDSETMRNVQSLLPGSLPVPFHRDMIRGFDAQKWEAEGLYVTVLFGEGYFGHDWRYYPWLILCKTTLGGLVLLVLFVVSFARVRPAAGEFPLFALILIVGVGMMTLAQINIGTRYLLPLYAPAIILLTRGLKPTADGPRPWFTWTAIVAVAAIALESVSATPRHASFRNAVARALDLHVPNQDWGQSLIDLRDWMRSNGQKRICLLYMGSADPAAYGIEWTDPFSPQPETEYVAMGRELPNGLPIRTRSGFAFVRPWRKLMQLPPAADLGGILVYRTSDVLNAAEGQPWVVRVNDWQEALREPELAPLRNFDERLRKE